MSDKIRKPSHYFNAPRQEMLLFVPDSVSRVLEVGCGEGRFSAELKRTHATRGSSLKVIGVEIDKDRAEVAKLCLDQVIVANVEHDNLDLAPASFDCIIFNDVLEHLVTPWRVLKSMQGLLAPGGCVIASIPNVRHLGVLKDLIFAADWRYTDEGVMDVTHLRFFTQKAISRMFLEQGYQVDTLVGINSRVRGWKFTLLNLLSNGHFNDTQYLQFAVVARMPVK
jgi:2-polyprenyl-3-methyl-5-hydroxy-6-metoxy-1,4-benzoquinol methylase